MGCLLKFNCLIVFVVTIGGDFALGVNFPIVIPKTTNSTGALPISKQAISPSGALRSTSGALSYASNKLDSFADTLDDFYPSILENEYSETPRKEIFKYKMEDKNGDTREEIGFIMNPDTSKAELVVMGSFTNFDEETDNEVKTMFTADKSGYQTRYIKNRQLSAGALKSSVG